ncbi:MAG: hypothetical protein U0893_16765 [Chloroflexota bacterium]
MLARSPSHESAWVGRTRTLFVVAALYDGILGVAFFFLYQPIFQLLGIPLPDNASYIHLSAGFIFVQGVGYWLVSRDLQRNLDLVRVGALYKAIYVAVAVYYLGTGQILHAVFAWFGLFDFVFLLLFLAVLRTASRNGAWQEPGG